MATMAAAKKAFSLSRKYYEDTMKSTNKNYDENSTSFWKRISGKMEKRNQLQPIANKTLGSSRDSLDAAGIFDPLDIGKLYYQSHMPAANCGELAYVACYLLSADGVTNDEIAVGTLKTDGDVDGIRKHADHVFCVYGKPEFLEYLTLYPKTIHEIGEETMFEDNVFGIDPWANVVCKIGKYPGNVKKKMKQWESYGKRVLWVHKGPNGGSEWTPPAGEYSDVFAAAKLIITKC